MCDSKVFDTLLQPVEDLLLNVIYRKVGDREATKEIYHDVIVLGLSNLHRLQDHNKFPAWIFAITRNVIAAYVKKVRRQQSRETLVDLQDPLNTPLLFHRASENVENIVLSKEENNRLKDAIDTLDNVDRIIIWLAYYQEMSLAEIAEIVDMTLGAVKMRKKRALGKLKKKLNL